jgi:hypothetical protein
MITAEKAQEIERDCQLIELHRVWRCYAQLFTASIRATELGISDADQAAMNRKESTDYQKATRATRKALDLGIDSRRIGEVIDAAEKEGHSDARAMMPDEIVALVTMFNN